MYWILLETSDREQAIGVVPVTAGVMAMLRTIPMLSGLDYAAADDYAQEEMSSLISELESIRCTLIEPVIKIAETCESSPGSVLRFTPFAGDLDRGPRRG